LARQMQIYSGRGQVQSEAFDVNALVKEMSSLLVSSLPGKVRMSPAMHVGELAMEGDPTQLRQLVMNLVLNAADAIGDVSGVVSVTTGTVVVLAEDLEGAFTGPDFSPGEHIFLEVGDSGKGLEESTRLRMFEPFFSTKSTGRGLGMSVVLGIVRGHGGALIVESELGVGTRIRAMLPTTTKAISHKRRFGAGPRKSAEVDPSGALVLLADDEASVLRFARAALLSMNLTVVTAENGLTAVEEYKSLLEAGTIPDLVVLDATMPVMGGIEAMDNIRLLGHDVPIVLSSGYTLEGVATRAAETAQCWFLPKPYGMTELTSLVMRVLSEGSQTPGA
jgi:two-component system cell cycle sensor histidine kinase/response regulator CckA